MRAKAALKFVLALAFALGLLIGLDNALMASNSSSLKVGQPMIVDNRLPQDDKHEKPIFTKRIVAPSVPAPQADQEQKSAETETQADQGAANSEDAALNVGQLDTDAEVDDDSGNSNNDNDNDD
ncbi:MAG: hypothetical protein ACK4VI_00680 [Alphaproteobacteria bacterium]